MHLDSHQHFWRYDTTQYSWIPTGSPLQRDWLPADLAMIHRSLGFSGSIAIQVRQSLAESYWMLGLADADPRTQGVVGWVNLRSDRVEEELEPLAGHPRFVGVRHIAQDEPDDRFLVQPDFLRGINRLRQFGLTYDILIYPQQLPAAIELVSRFPEQPFVLDHLAKPLIRQASLVPWESQIRELAHYENVLCKVSGMVTEAHHQGWNALDFRPYLDVVFEVFGSRR